jgi:hypothetical protein
MRHAACAAALLLATVACTEKQQEPVQDLAHDQELVKAASAVAGRGGGEPPDPRHPPEPGGPRRPALPGYFSSLT